MGETHGVFECKYDVHDPQLRVEQVMDFFHAPPRRIRRKKHADLVHCSTISLQVPKETFEIQIDGLLADCRPWAVDRQLWTKKFKQFPSPRYSPTKEHV